MTPCQRSVEWTSVVATSGLQLSVQDPPPPTLMGDASALSAMLRFSPAAKQRSEVSSDTSPSMPHEVQSCEIVPPAAPSLLEGPTMDGSIDEHGAISAEEGSSSECATMASFPGQPQLSLHSSGEVPHGVAEAEHQDDASYFQDCDFPDEKSTTQGCSLVRLRRSRLNIIKH
eukprot:TRINITY_DN81539_c0_g1_i1.p1 TRINITY_DN81539_c0_g1~~TRINITY_DN81539_c0_g1_i1.p1  ORF type:complete len:172 (+),score=29.90 TRINITY_DN81539_c0_g1_i1:160-675(+)